MNEAPHTSSLTPHSSRREKLVDQSFDRFHRADRTGVLASHLCFGPGKRFGERVPLIRSETGLRHDCLRRRRVLDRYHRWWCWRWRGRRIAGRGGLVPFAERAPEGDPAQDQSPRSSRRTADPQPGGDRDGGLHQPTQAIESILCGRRSKCMISLRSECGNLEVIWKRLEVCRADWSCTVRKCSLFFVPCRPILGCERPCRRSSRSVTSLGSLRAT